MKYRRDTVTLIALKLILVYAAVFVLSMLSPSSSIVFTCIDRFTTSGHPLYLSSPSTLFAIIHRCDSLKPTWLLRWLHQNAYVPCFLFIPRSPFFDQNKNKDLWTSNCGRCSSFASYFFLLVVVYSICLSSCLYPHPLLLLRSTIRAVVVWQSWCDWITSQLIIEYCFFFVVVALYLVCCPKSFFFYSWATVMLCVYVRAFSFFLLFGHFRSFIHSTWQDKVARHQWGKHSSINLNNREQLWIAKE